MREYAISLSQGEVNLSFRGRSQTGPPGYKFLRISCPISWDSMRGELGFYLHRTTPSVNESRVASSEIFPLLKRPCQRKPASGGGGATSALGSRGKESIEGSICEEV